MIIDTLENFHHYVGVNPLFSEVLDFIKSHDLKTMPTGIVKIKDDDLFANFCDAKGKKAGEAKVETHDQMIDIQIPLGCSETMGYIPRQKLPDNEYNSTKDITFYDENPEKLIKIEDGEFAVFFPQDGHAPFISESDIIHKVIFKVKA